MARPSQNLDRALLEAGIEEIKRVGVRGLSVRAVCARAGVNIRMLNYYFGTKDDFVRLLLTKTYEHFFRILKASVQEDGSPLDRLARALRLTVTFTVTNRELTRNLWMDANSGEPLVQELVQQSFPSHSRLMFELLYEAWKEGALRQDISPTQIFAAVMPGVFAHALWQEQVFPFNLSDLGDAVPPMPADPVEAAMQNFMCLLEGFRSRPQDEEPPRAATAHVNSDAPAGRADISPTPSKSRNGGQRSNSIPPKA